MAREPEFVTVGNPGNEDAPSDDSGSRYGGVDYTYRIGRYEVTYGQYLEFLNAKAKSDPTGLYDPSMTMDKIANGISRSGSDGGYSYSLLSDASADFPVAFVNFTDAARYTNWFNNGKGNSSTERGSYTITTANLKGAVRKDGVITYMAKGKLDLQAGDQITISGLKGIGFSGRSLIKDVKSRNGVTFFSSANDYPDAVARGRGKVVAVSASHSEDARVWIPSEDEWTKAAYYDPSLNNGTGGYYTWATRSNDYPGNSVGALPNQANIPSYVDLRFANTPLNPNISPSVGPNLLTAVGSFTSSPSYYGTFDQDGNVTEWTETIYDKTALFGNWNRSVNATRSKHGAMYYSGTPGSSRRDDGLMPNDIGYGTGFRLAALPISASTALVSSATNVVKSESSAHASHYHSSASGSDQADSASTSSVNTKTSGRAVFGGLISAAQEIWPTVYPASGTARVVLNPEQTALSYKFRIIGLDFGELAGIGPTTKATGDDVNGMHVHHAPAGQVGDPAIGLINPNQDKDIRYRYNPKTKYWTIAGRWTKEDPSVVSFDYNLKNYLFQGLDYLNIHNEDVALGVIRSQFYPLNDAAKAGYAASGSSSLQSSKSANLQASTDTTDCTAGHCSEDGDGLVQDSLKGSDLLTGSKNADRFRYDLGSDSSTKMAHRDIIIDFNPLEDRIDLRDLDADRTRPGIQSFVFSGSESFNDPGPGQLSYSKGVLEADLNGDSRPDFALKLAGAPALTADNFLL
jgi:formylglycine-generating enzyme required for sulfatase activity